MDEIANLSNTYDTCVYTIKTIGEEVEKIENNPNAERTRFVTFFNEEDANRAKRRLNGKKVGPRRLRIEVSHWTSGPSPIVPYTTPPRRLHEA